MAESLRDVLSFAVETAYLAGRLTLGYYQTGVRPDLKDDDSPVTAADREAEVLIRARIGERYPHHAIVGEELGKSGDESTGHRWYIDPVDGTKSFVRGVPLYAVLLGLEVEGQVEVGVAYLPVLDEMVAAATGEGCWWNGRRARVSDVQSLERATVVHSDAGSFSSYGRSQAWERVKQAAYYRAGWGDAYGHLLVATGRADIMLDPIMNVWDCAPFPPILQEAGGFFGDWDGQATIHGGEALSTTQHLLPQVLPLIREREPAG